MPKGECQNSFVLTPAESKRLIGRGVARAPAVRRAAQEGILAVAKGTTNGYVVEEITGRSIHKPHYCTGTTRPAEGGSEVDLSDELPDLVLRGGQEWEGVSAVEATSEMGPGDVFIKGANALNYDLRQAGILIGHPTGGTIGAALGTLVARRATLLLPVGLEKSVPGDLCETYHALAASGAEGQGPTLWPVEGTIFTELEALEDLCGVSAFPLAAGGILGAEGAVRISVWGTREEVRRAESLIGEIQGEPPFGA